MEEGGKKTHFHFGHLYPHHSDVIFLFSFITSLLVYVENGTAMSIVPFSPLSLYSSFITAASPHYIIFFLYQTFPLCLILLYFFLFSL